MVKPVLERVRRSGVLLPDCNEQYLTTGDGAPHYADQGAYHVHVMRGRYVAP